jgi:hypothetical protein
MATLICSAGRQLCHVGQLELAEAIEKQGGLERPWKKLPVSLWRQK